MAYTAELSQLDSAILRRLAWYMGKPMTKSLEMLIGITGMKMAEIKPGEVSTGTIIRKYQPSAGTGTHLDL
jgi:hypothetical protein